MISRSNVRSRYLFHAWFASGNTAEQQRPDVEQLWRRGVVNGSIDAPATEGRCACGIDHATDVEVGNVGADSS